MSMQCNLFFCFIECKQQHVCFTARAFVAIVTLCCYLYFNIYPGQEYPAVVEFAPFQKISKKKLKKKDGKAGSIEEGA